MNNSFEFSDNGIFIVRLEWLHETADWVDNNQATTIKTFQGKKAYISKEEAEIEFDKLYRTTALNHLIKPEISKLSYVITLSYADHKSLIGINELVIYSVNETDPLPWEDLKDGLYRTIKRPSPPKENEEDGDVYFTLD